MNEYKNFKHLLEYFVAHLEYCVTSNTNNRGYNQYIKNLTDFKKSGQGYKGQNIQTQVHDWEQYDNGIVYINVNAQNYKSKSSYLNWEDTGLNVIAEWDIDSIKSLSLKDYRGDSTWNYIDGDKSLDELGLFDNKEPNDAVKSFFDKYNSLIVEYNQGQNNRKDMEKIKSYVTLLGEVHNLIFTGAPGTGKTYLAKQIAKQIIGVSTDEELEQSGQFAFVQFHPSYDYTDFVEGLRPTKPDANGNIGFELKDGIFKAFCKKALNEFKIDNFEENYMNFVNELSEKDMTFETPAKKKKFRVEINNNKTCVAIPTTETATRMSITKEMIKAYFYNATIQDWKPYLVPIAEYFKNNYGVKIENNKTDAKYVFIIDEINRAEISKVFGELFFSIDPSYRGKKGAVKTQYSNLHDDESELFYIPENVYIIGTMNDIDRSVESFDFAMRRRFTWEEITAEQSAENMNLPDDIKNKMKNLNDAISRIEGLNTSFHIGGAYFLDKEGEPRTDYDNIWKYRIEPLLKEYLRGMPDADGKLKTLKEAYGN